MKIIDVSSSDICDKDRKKRDDARSISEEERDDLSWFEPSQEVITLRPVLLYYTNEFDTPDRLWAAIFIVWRTAS
jgi:hypothetical protein